LSTIFLAIHASDQVELYKYVFYSKNKISLATLQKLIFSNSLNEEATEIKDIFKETARISIKYGLAF
jgi:hypothetical protein